MNEMAQEISSDRRPLDQFAYDELALGVSAALEKTRRRVEKLSGTNLPILIYGESGTGKKVLARAIHRRHPGETFPFLLIASQEFRPPFLPGGPSGSDQASELAESGSKFEVHPCVGTACFSDISELRPSSQWKLMRMLHGDPPMAAGLAGKNGAGLRVICTTSRHLEGDVEAGKFRRDLFYCINAINIHLPPLRERPEDIPFFARYYWEAYSQEFNRRPGEPSAEMVRILQEQPWPGNIRELANVMKRYVLLGSEEALLSEMKENDLLHSLRGPAGGDVVSLKTMAREAARELERKVILKTLQESQWNRRRAARTLKISYRALLYKVKEAGLLLKKTGISREGLAMGSRRVNNDRTKERAI